MAIVFKPVPGSTLLIPSGPHHEMNKLHLFIILTPPMMDEKFEKILLVNLTSIYPGIHYDSSCILKVGEHPYIKHDSYILYSRARIERLDEMMKKVQAGIFIPKLSVSSSVLDRICVGLEKSQEIAPRIKKFYLTFKNETLFSRV